jgi:hypothetical protein
MSVPAQDSLPDPAEKPAAASNLTGGTQNTLLLLGSLVGCSTR